MVRFMLPRRLIQRIWSYVNPEHVIAYEVGEKSTVLNGRLQLNGSYSRYNYTDRQSLVNFISPVTGIGVSSLANIPKSAVDGFELEADVAP
jgi:iron complex outermembrane recepter protein